MSPIIAGIIAVAIFLAWKNYGQKKASLSEWQKAYRRLKYSSPHYESSPDDRTLTTLYTCLGEWKKQCPRCKSNVYCESDFRFDSNLAVTNTLYHCLGCGARFWVQD